MITAEMFQATYGPPSNHYVTSEDQLEVAVYSARTVLQDKGDDVCILGCSA